MSESYDITWWKYTGEMSPFVDGIASPIMYNIVTFERLSQRDLPFGACYVTNIDPESGEARPTAFSGKDGYSIGCVVPCTSPADPGNKGTWYIDSRASNCARPNDWNHRCWVRHGSVGERLTVDKAGETCAAGAGSIQFKGWHGFLHGGVLHT